jgi:hypothetical protein
MSNGNSSRRRQPVGLGTTLKEIIRRLSSYAQRVFADPIVSLPLSQFARDRFSPRWDQVDLPNQLIRLGNDAKTQARRNAFHFPSMPAKYCRHGKKTLGFRT